MIELSASMIGLGALQFRGVVGESATDEVVAAGLRLLRQAPLTAAAALPEPAGRPWRELANKLEAFEHFRRAPALLGLDGGGGTGGDLDATPLAEALRRAAALGPYRCTWATEGLGHARARRALAAGDARGLLAGEGLPEVPGRAVLALHTGAALAFAEHLLEGGRPAGRDDLERWLASWAAAVRPAYRDLAAEALGLVARNLAPQSVSGLARALGKVDPALADGLWHGAGRGLYFAPTHALPWSGAHGRGFEKARREPAGESGRRNAAAGLAWALTLVNVRDPEIVAGALAPEPGGGGGLACPDAVAHGVSSALVVWHDAVGRDEHLERFLDHRPAGGAAAARWEELVAACRAALERAAAGGRREAELAALFRCPPAAGGAGR